jgi:hypothetical protein
MNKTLTAIIAARPEMDALALQKRIERFARISDEHSLFVKSMSVDQLVPDSILPQESELLDREDSFAQVRSSVFITSVPGQTPSSVCLLSIFCGI